MSGILLLAGPKFKNSNILKIILRFDLISASATRKFYRFESQFLLEFYTQRVKNVADNQVSQII